MLSVNEEENSVQYIYRISSNYDSMSKTEKKIAKYFIEHKDDMRSSSITVLARKIGSSPAAITRFCQSLHFKGFSEFKFCMEKDSLLSIDTSKNRIRPEDSISVIIQKMTKIDLGAVADTMMLINKDKLERVAALIAKANRVYFLGEGATGCTANLGYGMFMQIGIPCSFFTDSGFMRMSTSVLKPGDAVFGITYSGEATNIIDSMRMAKENGATTISITAKSDSRLAIMSDFPLVYSCNIEDDLLYYHVARICEIAILGLLQVGIVRNSEQSSEKIERLKTAITKVRENKNIRKK